MIYARTLSTGSAKVTKSNLTTRGGRGRIDGSQTCTYTTAASLNDVQHAARIPTDPR